jgi:hypothetical protein
MSAASAAAAACTAFPPLKAGEGVHVQPIPPALPTEFPVTASGKPRVFLTSVKIPDDHIWANGLFQNVYVIYKMLETLGFEPWILVDNNEGHKDAKVHEKFRLTDFKEYMAAPFPIVSYVEMGMSCDPAIRRFFRNMGAKVSKLYLGNILNIDIETVTFLPGANFSHHVAGELDEIWVSPHYDIHAEYAGSVNGLCGRTRIAPYVWDPHFLENVGQPYNTSGLTVESPRTFLVMEPNISFQKNALIPILALEAYYREFPSRVDQVIVVNGERFKANPYFQSSVAPNLTILRDGKLQLMPRAHMINVVRVFKNPIVLQHQVNNAYNYSTLEWFTLGYPVIHNVPQFKDYGYYYDRNDFESAAALISTIVAHHDKNVEAYKAHAKQLAWRFSPYNPENAEAWKRLLLEKTP